MQLHKALTGLRGVGELVNAQPFLFDHALVSKNRVSTASWQHQCSNHSFVLILSISVV